MYTLSVILYIISFIFSIMTSVALLVKPRVYPYLDHNLKDKNSAIQKRYKIANIVAGVLSILLGATLFLGQLLYFKAHETSSFVPLICVFVSIVIYFFIIVLVPFLIIKTGPKRHNKEAEKL